MLNPSIADDKVDDPTIKKCIKFAEREGCTDLTVVNLFSFRATDPNELLINDIEHPENNGYILSEVENTLNPLVICAWGSHKSTRIAKSNITD